MQISRDSWHYKLIDWCDFSHPHNLCAYFWKTVLVTIGVPVWGLSCVVVGTFLVIAALAPLWWYFFDNFFPLAVLMGAGEIVALSWLLGKVIMTRREEEILSGEREQTEPSLFTAWLRAKHRKICPLLKFN